jgi:hypothetical protein
VKLDQLAANRETEAENNGNRALSWAKRKNWCDKAAKFAAALLAGVAAVLAVSAAPKLLPAE